MNKGTKRLFSGIYGFRVRDYAGDVCRIESQGIKLTIDRLQKIAEILETDMTAFFDSSKLTIQIVVLIEILN